MKFRYFNTQTNRIHEITAHSERSAIETLTSRKTRYVNFHKVDERMEAPQPTPTCVRGPGGTLYPID